MTKTLIERTFNGVVRFESDAWVADYTEMSKGLPAEERRGVVIQALPFSDICAFHLSNPQKLEFFGVNFEKNAGFFPQGVKDCECMFKSDTKDKGWLLLCELKYCLEGNIGGNASKAYKQLTETWSLLSSRHLFNKKHCHCWLNISVPDHSDKAPFTSFLLSQDDKISWCKEHKVHLLGVNDVVVINKGILQVSNVPI